MSENPKLVKIKKVREDALLLTTQHDGIYLQSGKRLYYQEAATKKEALRSSNNSFRMYSKQLKREGVSKSSKDPFGVFCYDDVNSQQPTKNNLIKR